MTCEDIELELTAGDPSPTVKAHLATCASCQETARVLGLARLPEPSDTERLLLSSVAATVQREWRRQPPRASLFKRSLGYALAAGVGALIASGVILKLRPAPVTPPAPAKVEPVAFTEPNLVDDEVFLEVGWPSPTEGDL
jgi:hypothetical protein